MQGDPIRRGWLRRLAVPALLLCLNACAMVGVSQLKPGDVVSERRIDVIGGKQFSDSTVQALNVLALNAKQCTKSFGSCTEIVERASGLDEERRLSALSELWLGRALRGDRGPVMDDATLDAYLQCARYAYAYLFYTRRTPAERRSCVVNSGVFPNSVMFASTGVDPRAVTNARYSSSVPSASRRVRAKMRLPTVRRYSAEAW